MNYTAHASEKKGFTMLELSIVIVILGLIVGGIMAGTSLVRASELRSVTAEYSKYSTALNTFRDKYFGLPGDMSNASSYWTGEPVGDGDGFIEGSTTAASNETGHFWRQLGLSGLAEGNYTPASWAAINPPTTSPRSRLAPGHWNMRYVGTVTENDAVIGTAGAATQVAYEGAYGNAFFLISGTTLVTPSGGVMKTEEAWNIDTKMDDGRPATGSILTLESQTSSTSGSGCGNLAKLTTTSAASQYDLANTSVTACSLVFISGQ